MGAARCNRPVLDGSGPDGFGHSRDLLRIYLTMRVPRMLPWKMQWYG